MSKIFKFSTPKKESHISSVQKQTAVFTSFNNEKNSWFKNFIYRCMIRRHALSLLNKNYHFFIVSFGNTYGRIAMLELLKLRKKFQFHIIAQKIIGEHPPNWTHNFNELVVFLVV